MSMLFSPIQVVLTVVELYISFVFAAWLVCLIAGMVMANFRMRKQSEKTISLGTKILINGVKIPIVAIFQVFPIFKKMGESGFKSFKLKINEYFLKMKSFEKEKVQKISPASMSEVEEKYVDSQHKIINFEQKAKQIKKIQEETQHEIKKAQNNK